MTEENIGQEFKLKEIDKKINIFLKYIYQNTLHKAYFQHDMAYRDLKVLPRKTTADKAFNIAKNPKYVGHQKGLASVVYDIFDKKSSNTNTGTAINSDIVSENKRPSNLAT